MAEILIRNGFVIDPTRNINGDVADIAIKDGQIVEGVGSKAKVIDASGKVVMAGGVDVHSHVAGPKVNVGRLMRPEDKLFKSPHNQKNYRMESGFSIPSTFKTGYDYARMGYAFVMEAAMPPLHSPHVHEEIHDTPIIDQAALPVFGNSWFVFEYLKNEEIDNCAAYIAWLLKVTKGFGIKVVNPGGSSAWAWGLNCLTLSDPVPYFDITPAEIITGLMKTNEYLGLPHSMHIHHNDLGNPGNYETTLESLRLAEGVATKNNFGRDTVMHSTHIQFHSYGGDSWGTFESKAREVMDYVNKQKNISIDLGCVTLDETTTMTADGPFEHHITNLNHLKWANTDVELETAAGVVPYVYDKDIKVNGIQWAIGLEMGLYATDPMRTFITTDHPNAGPFTRYPRIIKWLMSKQAREETLASFKHTDKVIDATDIHSMDRELSLFEIAQMTRAGPAKALGLSNMFGGLGVGMDANVGIFDLNFNDMPADPEAIEKAFSRACWFIKSGEIIVKEGDIVSHGNKRTIWVKPNVAENPQVIRDIQDKFLKDYSVGSDTYQVRDYLAPNPYVIEFDVEA
ncbi:MAG: Amidohydrolase 3 [Methanomicrobiales archaeon 53_19]|jgi:formylmethanofuran dehydrogenase subunit A|uniref:formylmethanofuran dehydrogenase subunit A n=1 Tax=Methanocalculus sp. TaxID=2004547 RepID=UPI00074A61FB|nr:formylmethanofuran dehydrogenase subunit A [Methanocalculus sp.]KUK69254.1 MAG: Amidohydrolase 3 [Methanocalculus sp. 52_23]KUL02674.1 MAG: Amidohydrolase 3 [Methanomicrobiales archaeon 53_19]HIJ07623.1 formylmethanofuran dehydrogenase subunit A [Methanocalculus sp.]